jgi:hypothetical protein
LRWGSFVAKEYLTPNIDSFPQIPEYTRNEWRWEVGGRRGRGGEGIWEKRQNGES